MRLLLIRHGPTAWNDAGRLQGRHDEPLSARGRAVVGRWRLPGSFAAAPIVSSPLRRARQTARILAGAPVEVVDALVEMDWGAFEGRRLAELRAEDPGGMAVNEARGLDFTPVNGESPRAVRDRLAAVVALWAEVDGALVAVTHKGVMRAALSLATGWDMTTKPPLRLRGDTGLPLWIQRSGTVTLAGGPVLLGPQS